MDNHAVNGALSATLLTTPWWHDALTALNTAAATVSVVCGAIIGVATLWKMYRGDRR